MENQQQYYPQTPLQQMPPVKKTKPLYKKWWFWTFMVCNTFVIGILFLSLLAAVDENLKYQAALQEANEKISQLESQISSLEFKNGDLELKLEEKKLPFADSPITLIDNISSLKQFDKLFDFNTFELSDESDKNDLLTYLAFSEFYIHSNLFYNLMKTSSDKEELKIIANQYLLSATRLATYMRKFEKINDEDFNFIKVAIIGHTGITEKFLSSLETEKEINKEIIEEMLKFSKSLNLMIQGGIDSSVFSDVLNNLN